jgi:hypothetical protein
VSEAAQPSPDAEPAKAPHRGFSDVLHELAESDRERVSVAAILDAFGDRAFGALLLVFALPNALPMPPGTSAVLGAPLVFIAFQLMVGRQVLWLPGFITNRSLKRADFATLATRVGPWIERLERLLKERYSLLSTPFADRLTGAACFVLSLILFLPIPLGNMPPAAAITAFALGIIERDGVAIAVGWFGTVVSVLILAALSTAIGAAISSFADPVMRFFGA